MNLTFWRHQKQTAELDAIEHEAKLVHRENIKKIVKTRQKVDTLNVALQQNNIVFQLAHVIGHQK